MSKKLLLSVAAVALLAMTAFAGDYKYESWPTVTYTKTVTDTKETRTLIETIPVYIHIPYYVVIWPQNSEIQLQQVGQEGDERFHFSGVALWRDSDGHYHKPNIKSNFNADLTVKCVRTADGNTLSSYNPNGSMKSVWSTTVSPSAIAALVQAELTITCDVTYVNLLAFAQCSNLHVADVLLYIMHQ